MSEPKTTKTKILERITESPASWTDLLEGTGVSKPTLYQHLTELQERRLIKKNPEGLYIATESGRKELERRNVFSKLKKLAWATFPGGIVFSVPERIFDVDLPNTPIEKALGLVLIVVSTPGWDSDNQIRARVKEILAYYASKISE